MVCYFDSACLFLASNEIAYLWGVLTFFHVFLALVDEEIPRQTKFDVGIFTFIAYFFKKQIDLIRQQDGSIVAGPYYVFWQGRTLFPTLDLQTFYVSSRHLLIFNVLIIYSVFG